jgi:predicted AAA+ superfamily ATPase
VLGSSSLLLQKGLSESLAGRFLLYPCTHWSYEEMEAAFKWDLDKWIFFGGYPGAAGLIRDQELWRKYITDSLIETVLARDVLQLQTITKPALLRQVFGYSVSYPAQIVSYNKMLGQLQDAGNTTTISHYLKLLETAYLVSGLERFRQGRKTKRASSPKLIPWSNALINSLSTESFQTTRQDSAAWGRLVENAVGAYLLNNLTGPAHAIYYWRQKDYEVDFVIKTPKEIWAVEVKSGKSGIARGLSEFMKKYKKAHPLFLGYGGMQLERFFKTNPAEIFS